MGDVESAAEWLETCREREAVALDAATEAFRAAAHATGATMNATMALARAQGSVEGWTRTRNEAMRLVAVTADKARDLIRTALIKV